VNWAEIWIVATTSALAANVAFLVLNRRDLRRILRSHRELRAMRDAGMVASEGARALAYHAIAVLDERMRIAERHRVELQATIERGDRVFGIKRSRAKEPS
jgi:hypothetical protein